MLEALVQQEGSYIVIQVQVIYTQYGSTEREAKSPFMNTASQPYDDNKTKTPSCTTNTLDSDSIFHIIVSLRRHFFLCMLMLKRGTKNKHVQQLLIKVVVEKASAI